MYHSVYNELKNQNQKLEEKAENLERLLASLSVDDEKEEKKEGLLRLESLKEQYKSLEDKIADEYMYQESLQYMKGKIRTSAIAIAQKTKKVQNKVKIKGNKCEDAEKNYQRVMSKVLVLSKETGKLRQELSQRRAERDIQMDALLVEYEHRERLKQCAMIEKKKQATLARHKEKVNKINDLEKKLSSLKEEEMLNEEQVKIEIDIEKQEQKFAMIQRAINVATIDDILSLIHI